MTKQDLERGFAAIDIANSQDPTLEEADGASHPVALLYGQRMSAWLEKLCPDASDALRLAVRAQHIRRWDIPRDSFPMDRTGYLMWRKRLYKYHAEVAEKILRDQGFDGDTIERVKFIIEKRQLNKDPDSQSLEDCACLVFLQYHFAAFAPAHEPEKLIPIVQKTWGKMSPKAQAYALTLDFSPEHLALLKQALQ